MKHQIKNLSFLSILVLLVALNIYGQKVNEFTESKEAISEPDVNEFFSSFVRSLDETGDIDKIPKRFFHSDFKIRFAQDDDWIHSVSESDAKLFNKLSSPERYKYNVSVANFYYLLLESYFNKQGSLVGFDDEKKIMRGLPRNTLQLIKQSIWFKSTFDNQVKTAKPTTLKKLESCIAELDKISDSIKTFLNKRSMNQKRKYNRDWAKRRKLQIINRSNTSNDICEGDNCMGLPEKTRIHAIHAFALCLRIALVNGEYRVINIFAALNED